MLPSSLFCSCDPSSCRLLFCRRLLFEFPLLSGNRFIQLIFFDGQLPLFFDSVSFSRIFLPALLSSTVIVAPSVSWMPASPSVCICAFSAWSECCGSGEFRGISCSGWHPRSQKNTQVKSFRPLPEDRYEDALALRCALKVLFIIIIIIISSLHQAEVHSRTSPLAKMLIAAC